MQKSNQPINGVEFLKLLIHEEGNVADSLVVQGDVRIDGEESPLERLYLANITFTGSVWVRGFKKKPISLVFQSSNFLDGLGIEQCVGISVSVGGCRAKWLHVWQCQYHEVSIGDTKIDRSLDFSGLLLTTGLKLREITFGQLELMHSSHSGHIKTPMVRTDDLLVATQCRLAGIPVFMSTDAVRTQLAHASTAIEALSSA